jgi:exo-beta-1,3-glucanase (GH17 family)
MRVQPTPLLLLLAVPFAAGLTGLGSDPARAGVPREEPFVVRSFRPYSGERWIGNAVAYGPHRDGQRPGGPAPSRAELREDLQLMLPHWNLLRLYGASGVAGTILELIREDELDMKVMLGVWIAPEEERDAEGRVVARDSVAAAANRTEVAAAIRLAAAFPELIVAVAVGNETQVDWSAHRSPLDILIGYVREVRAAVPMPVTSVDDFKWWLAPESRTLAREIDFVTMHAHPLWNGRQLEEGMAWMLEQIAAVQDLHADREVVLGETGWATSVADVGEQATLIKGRVGEAEQKVFYDEVRAWAAAERMTVFVFEAFDENWKGGDDPAEVEKHWGLFNADRTPKAAVRPGSE